MIDEWDNIIRLYELNSMESIGVGSDFGSLLGSGGEQDGYALCCSGLMIFCTKIVCSLPHGYDSIRVVHS